MALIADKYRPKDIDSLDFHPDLTFQLKHLAGHDDLPHLLFHGSSGAGKQTRVDALIGSMYGNASQKV